MSKLPIVILLNNVRSLYNVGSILRTADAVGAQSVVCCGYTPYPLVKNDPRPKFEAERTTKAIAKTALGAQKTMAVEHCDNASDAIRKFQEQGFQIVTLEQAQGSLDLFSFKPQFPLVLTLGHEVDGHDPGILGLVDQVVEIPMQGQKESLNVSVAAGIALYQLAQNVV